MQSQVRRYREIMPESQAVRDPRARVREALGAGGAALHELDYEDLALATAGMRLVRQAAVTVLRRFANVEARDVPLSRALALFLDHVYWNEETGGLILCADFPDKSYCLPVPREMWGLKARQGRVQ